MARILLTRSREGNREWAAEVEAAGHEPMTLDCLRHEHLDDPATRARLADLWRRARWWAFTSARGVESPAALGIGSGASVESGPSLAAVGPTTADACRHAFGRCDLVASTPTGRGLAEELAAHTKPGDLVALPTADRGRRDLEEILGPRGVTVERVTVYRTVPASPVDDPVDLDALGLDAVFLASPSAIEGLEALSRRPEHGSVPYVTIGPTTASAVEGRGFPVIVAAKPSLAGMLRAYEEFIRAGGTTPGAGQSTESDR